MRYRDAGVDLDKHWAVHRAVSQYLGGARGLYTSSVELGGAELTLHVDGVGTKALLALELDRLEVAGRDCVAVNVNDIVCDGFKPVAVVDYVAVEPQHLEKVPRVVAGVASKAGEVGAQLLGGETAVLPGVIHGIDVVCTVLGVKAAYTRPPAPGDILIGLPSTGPHANGYSLLRRLFKPGEEVCGRPAAELLLAEVADYSAVLNAVREGAAAGAVHITGGGYRKLKKALGGLGAEVAFDVPCLFREVVKRGVEPREAYQVFNMGVGMVVYTPRDRLAEALRALEPLNPKPIGEVKQGGGLRVNGVEI
ncbi:phosphoribosylformylglycinamidine cyclo-ligase [Pyrobaculum neutrophilum]|uniref:phosphoribosylformylglycinamidine cyclo-ligase n=1 Tax=Pyrobaculum neutrophilum (strain DSM 2338 / JCM 9278 / NBRC 100436 / V24Sta) TaxID=444157 RepID=B1YBL6_PYRNV|nr:phosphoribosylformylglycinamidine cyclo-ligase [Pyrobaculum neutrophilum]ACB40818.1 Phosphoribosylformylglycinamidine cyclo-ligase [Pyrobaculum neutrophilum V24Sta]